MSQIWGCWSSKPGKGTQVLSELAPLAFQGYVTLNRIQSIVYPTAYKTNENLLICGTYHVLF